MWEPNGFDQSNVASRMVYGEEKTNSNGERREPLPVTLGGSARHLFNLVDREDVGLRLSSIAVRREPTDPNDCPLAL